MARSNQEVRKELTEQISKCSIISINGETYFGKLTVDSKEKSAKLENAVAWAGNVKETVRAWLKAFNKSNLESFEINGDATYIKKELNEDQQDEAELVIIACGKAMANSLPDLINSNF